MTAQAKIVDALAQEKLPALAARLQQLPDPDPFKKQVESDLWTRFVPADKRDATEIAYEELSPEGQELIGYIETEDGEGAVPWWLRAFKWEATTIGEDALTLNSVDRLEQFEDFVIGETTIRKPELLHERIGVSNDLYGAVENFKNLFDELNEHLEVPDQRSPELELPDHIFRIADDRLQTTNEFQNWVTELLQLCPPFNEQLTALLMVLSKADGDLAQEILPEQVATNLESIGVITGSGVFNNTYFDSLGSDRDSLLTYQWSVFDLRIPYVNASYDHLGPLEAAFYESWIEDNTAFIKQHKEWFYLKGRSARPINSQPAFGQVALRSPIVQKQGRATYCTLSLRSNGRYSTANDQQGKRREINHILQQNGIAEDE